MKGPNLPRPDLRWDQRGAPYSEHFDDIYFDPERGADESTAVFLDGNDLSNRWAGRRRFVIGETGFGTGLNFLLTWARWRRQRQLDQYLHFVSVEGLPLSADDLQRANDRWPQLRDVNAQLLAQYPTRERGFHRLIFGDGVTLTLLFDEVGSALRELEARIDAWYLDGFAPAQNKAMWREEVFAEIARLSAPGATLATFTAAGFVRRGLQAAGFAMRKTAGYGRKRERLLGHLEASPRPSRLPLWAQTSTASHGASNATIVGAGVAGLFLDQALKRRGVKAAISGEINHSASAIAAANVMPRLSVDHGKPARLMVSAFRFARNQWQSLDAWQAFGCLHLPVDAEGQRFKQMAETWATAGVAWAQPDQVNALSGVQLNRPGLWFPDAGLVAGDALARLLTLSDTVPSNETDPCFLATGAGSMQLPAFSELPLTAYRGQLTALAATAASQRLRTTLVAERYLTPAINGVHQLGATFDRITPDQDTGRPSAADDQRNLAAAAGLLTRVSAGGVASNWRGLRLATPDRLPLAGPLPGYATFIEQFGWLRGHERPPRQAKGWSASTPWCLTALGARGFTTAPLLAELVVSQWLGDPWPIERELALLLHPARFWVRDLKRQRR